MIKRIILIFLLILLILVVNGQGCEQQPECHSNTDCTKVQITCCPCNMGGKEKCVPRFMVPLYEKEMEECPPPEDLVCPALYNCEIASCNCIDGYCKEIPEEE